jgi:copper chaperone
MRQTYEVQNVKCGGCAATLKKSLLDVFGEVEVDLDVTPRTITLEIAPQQEEALKLALRKLGYPLVGDELGTFGTLETKAKSFVSCAIGRMGEEKA